jgi:cytochrome c-type biogenesis protein CcmF
MLNAIGSSALMVALGIAVLGLIAAVVGARRGDAAWIRGAYAAAYTNFGLLVIATIAMVTALVTHDFSVSYVAQVGSRTTPLFYTIISLWGALEGSILLWGLVLTGYTALVVYINRHREGKLVPYATATLFGIAAFFLILLVGPANPFHTVFPVPADGPGPNPLLQNHPLMAVHPPFLYLGYVGMSVPFAFAIGALLSGETGGEWIRSTRRWTIVAWAFLGFAIVAGMWWSYDVLGWGGYWAWDPVENASFMPWLTATAFIHSEMVEERRGMLRVWNMSLVVATFALTILGTFLTRSGILSSVHAFAEGPIGWFFLGFIGFVLLFSMVLLAGQSTTLKSKGRLDAFMSRETIFLFNNLLLTGFMFTVLLGTLFPLVAEMIRGPNFKVSVGAPFFNSMTLPICAALLLLMGVGPALPWRSSTKEQLRQQLMPPTVVMVVVAISAFVAGLRQPYALAAFAFGAFAITANLREYWRGVRSRMTTMGESFFAALVGLVRGNRRRYGGYLSHMGVLVLALGVTASSAFRMEHEATIKPGGAITLAGYTVRLKEMWGREEPQRVVVGADLYVERGGKRVGMLDPRLNYYKMSEQPVATPAVRSRGDADLYVNLMAFERDGSSATFRVLVEPLVSWIWFGGMIVALGAIVSLWPGGKANRVVPGAAPRESVEDELVPATAGGAE